ncbi:MAG: cobalamin biosynthesis bifunctional protein CbiET [Rhodospirillaceae bacterium]|nr:MAG: cobalamin biosynthesis bifunctional protein CbiET [Rhodospirillaceae bacterium]
MIFVIGIGEDGLAGLTESAKAKIAAADILLGGQRHLNFVADFSGERMNWSDGIDATLDRLESHLKQNIVVLASGDPLYFGVAKNVIERFGLDAVQVLPVPGSVSLACAAMGWSQPDVQVVTVHGRSLHGLNLFLTPGVRLVVLCQDGDTPARAAALLTAKGFGQSRICVLEHLGGPKENRRQGRASDWSPARTADLCTLAIELRADENALSYSRLAGLPDDAFDHDGQLTKRTTRAVTLSSLAPKPGEMLWDFGGGAGSISIEWMRTHPSCKAITVERDRVRAARIIGNADHLGVPKLAVKISENLEALNTFSGSPDAIFIGGGLNLELVEAAWARLKPGGRFVANAVTDKTRDLLKTIQSKYGGELFTMSIVNKLPITQILMEKKK